MVDNDTKTSVRVLEHASISLPDDELMTRKEVARFAKVSIQTVKNWEYSRRLEAKKVTARITRYRRSDVLKLLGL